MNKRKMTVFAVLAAVLLTSAIFIVFLNTTVAGNLNPEISLPPAPTEDATGGNSGVNIPDIPSYPIEDLDITPQNVQSIIKHLNRPDSYSVDLEVEYHWSSGQSRATKRTWVVDGVVRWQHFDLSGNPYLNYVFTNEGVYVWEEGEDSYMSYPEGEFSADDFGQIPTYEDVLNVSKEDIIAASYEDLDSVPCVKTIVAEEDSSYTRVYHVALENGILWSAEVFDGDRTIYRMSVIPSTFSTERPASSLFRLPDGSNLLYPEQ